MLCRNLQNLLAVAGANTKLDFQIRVPVVPQNVKRTRFGSLAEKRFGSLAVKRKCNQYLSTPGVEKRSACGKGNGAGVQTGNFPTLTL